VTRPLTENNSKDSNKRPAWLTRASLALFVKGFCMGASDVIPGVSGGTMALILGIYEELIQSIKAFDGALLRMVLKGHLMQALKTAPLRFLLPLGVGILTAIFTLARGLSWLLETHPVAIWSFFFGLVLASAIMVGRRIEQWTLSAFTSLLISAVGAYVMVALVPVKTPETLPFIFLCGAIAICAMILPGISGSFILVLLGKYHFILDAVGRLDILVLSVFTAGTATGIMLFVRLLNWLLKHYYQITMAALTGLMIGSLRKIWPWKSMTGIAIDGTETSTRIVNIFPHQLNTEVLFALGLAVFGGLVVLLLQRLAKQ
jgi:putative membrane protein